MTTAPCPLPRKLPPNLGAHRLAWWLAASARRVADFRKRLRLDRAGVERMLDGEFLPAEPMAIVIARTTMGAVRPEDWDMEATGGWTDRPPARAA